MRPARGGRRMSTAEAINSMLEERHAARNARTEVTGGAGRMIAVEAADPGPEPAVTTQGGTPWTSSPWSSPRWRFSRPSDVVVAAP